MAQNKEHLPAKEIAPELVESFITTFISRCDCYPQQLPDGSYVYIKQRLTTDLVMAHLRGNITIGAYALAADSTTQGLCLDADNDDQWQQLMTLAKSLENSSVTAYLELSRRGGHLRLFTPLLSGKNIRQFGNQLLALHGIEKVELYPKQDQLKTGPGSLVRLPFGIHQKTGRRYHFIHSDGTPLAPTIREQIVLLANPNRVPQGFIDEVIATIPPNTPPSPPKPTKTPDGSLPLSEQIKQSISVYGFVQNYVELDDRGRGRCPFHDDQHKSFGVNIEHNFWNCFLCGGGSVIDFMMKWREKRGDSPTFKDTLAEMARLLLK